MASLSDVCEDATLDWLAANKLLFVGLMTATAGESAAGTEVSGGSYARQSITWSAASGGAITNSALVQFPVPSAGWGSVIGFAFFIASSGGVPQAYGDQSPAKTINIGDDVEYAIGDIDFTLD